MRIVKIIRHRLRSLFSRATVDRELEEELQYHLERQMEESLATGKSIETVRVGVQQRKEECRDMRGLNLIDNAARDMRFTLRQFRKNPGFTATAILVLALGMSASVAIFAFVDAAFVRPLPYKDPARLMSLHEVSSQCPVCTVSYLNFQDWKKLSTAFQSMAAYRYATFMLSGPDGAQSTYGFRVSDRFFRTLGVTPVLGRDFYDGEDSLSAARVALITYSTWQRRYGGKSDVLGKTLILSDTPFTIVGVLPPEFLFSSSAAEFWTPLKALPGSCEARRRCGSDRVVARLKDGISIQAATAELKVIAQRLEKDYPDDNRGMGATIVTLTESRVGAYRPILLLLLAGAALLLLIASVNVASLLLVRAEGRKREIAVRSALGASQPRILGQFITEALVLVAAGTTLALFLAAWAMRVLTTLIPWKMAVFMPFLANIGVSSHVTAFGGGIAVLAAILFSLTPALHLSLSKTRDSIAEGARGSSGKAWSRLGSKLVVVELATAVVLLVGAGLLGKSLYHLLHVELGFAPDHVVTIEVGAPRSYAASDEKAKSLEPELISRIAGLPDVKSVAISSDLPVQYWDGATWLQIVGKPIQGPHNEVPERSVSSAYFTTLGAKLARGRYFTEAEDVSKPHVAIINQAFASKYFPGENPIGRQLMYERTGPQVPMEIVGVVEDVKEGQLDSVSRPVLYVPFVHYVGTYFNILIRTSGEEKTLLAALSATIHQLDANIVARNGARLPDVINDSEKAYLHRSAAVLVGGFAGLALLLGIVGLYGVVSYSVGQRTREIGIRMALGADHASVKNLVLKEALRLTAAGIVIGIGCSLAAATLMRSFLFGVVAWDLETFAAVGVTLAASSILASYIPARSAAAVNPVEALRSE